ncbi:MAG: type IV pilus secretin PilQ [Proteobacteria bacterium]|nr:type IV pilus secretin PilQ [Pseudomonadota bacterium]
MKHAAWNRFIGVKLVFLWAIVTASFIGCSALRGPDKPALPPTVTEPVTITAINFSDEEDYTRVTIEGSGEFMYEFLELLEDPLRISVKIANASFEVTTPIVVDDGTVTEIVAMTVGDRGRIDIGLTSRVDYTITQEATRLYVDIEKAEEMTPLAIAEPEPPISLDPAKALTDVSVAKRGDITEVTITTDGLLGDYNAFTLESPARLVIDLWTLKSRVPKAKATVPAGTAHLKRVRIGRHPKKTRLVLDSSRAKLAPYRIDRFQSKLVVAMGDVAALEREMASVLDGVDFKQIDDKSRMVLSSSTRVDYEIFKMSQRDIVVELKKTNAPKHVKRALDTKAFDSAVEYIRIYNVRSETSRDVRVVIHLREAVDFEAFQEGKRIFVDFQRPRAGGRVQTEQEMPEVTPEALQVEKTMAAETTTEEVNGQGEKGEPETETPAAVGEELAAGDATPAPEKVASPLPAKVAEEKPAVEKSTKTIGNPGEKEKTAEAAIYEFGITPEKEYTGRRLSLDFKDADIKNILRLIAEVSDLNIVAGENVKGKVTIRLIDVPWDQALDIILFSNNLGMMRIGNVIRVAPVDVLKKEQEQVLTSKRTQEKLEDLVTELIPVNYSTAQELSTQVKTILSERGSVSTDSRTNTLIVKDIPTSVVEARELVTTLDTKTPQVIIEARIVEASTNFSRELGIKWGGTLADTRIGGETGTVGVSGSVTGASPADTIANFPIGGATSAITFSLANLGDITNLDVELSALETAGEGEIISAPRIATLDNKEASIEQGLRIPYLKLTAEGTATTEFIEANIKLTVTPHVTNDGHIKMNIKASKDTPDDSITVQGVPAIDKKEAITEVLVKDGDIVVIAGIYSIEKSDNVERVPLLGKIPILGYFFKSTIKNDDRRDLLIFISPKIVQETA